MLQRQPDRMLACGVCSFVTSLAALANAVSLFLDRAEHDASDEVPLDEGVDE